MKNSGVWAQLVNLHRLLHKAFPLDPPLLAIRTRNISIDPIECIVRWNTPAPQKALRHIERPPVESTLNDSNTSMMWAPSARRQQVAEHSARALAVVTEVITITPGNITMVAEAPAAVRLCAAVLWMAAATASNSKNDMEKAAAASSERKSERHVVPMENLFTIKCTAVVSLSNGLHGVMSSANLLVQCIRNQLLVNPIRLLPNPIRLHLLVNPMHSLLLVNPIHSLLLVYLIRMHHLARCIPHSHCLVNIHLITNWNRFILNNVCLVLIC
jgi:hypothetical protein